FLFLFLTFVLPPALDVLKSCVLLCFSVAFKIRIQPICYDLPVASYPHRFVVSYQVSTSGILIIRTSTRYNDGESVRLLLSYLCAVLSYKLSSRKKLANDGGLYPD
ncbi:hypothetical protein JAAARDRAFT_72189, partial [Jaapia argillacea MUCL 33604]